jgi:hypothetical protein
LYEVEVWIESHATIFWCHGRGVDKTLRITANLRGTPPGGGYSTGKNNQKQHKNQDETKI